MIYVILTISIILTLFFGYSWFNANSTIKKMSMMISAVTPESRKNDLSLVFHYMNIAIIKTLHKYSLRDYKFNDKSPIQLLVMGHYRDLITYLLRNDIFLDSDISDDGKVSFFTTFMINVYYEYISTTPESIKNLFFKYYSGYDIETYNERKTEPPSVEHFLTEYTRNYLWLRFNENQIAEKKLLSEVGNSSEGYLESIQQYDSDCLRKLSLSIYNINDLGLSIIPENETKTER